MFSNLTGWQIALLVLFIIGVIYLIYHWMNRTSTTESTLYESLTDQVSMATSSGTKREVPFTLYNFYSPDCGYSQQFMPSWNMIADRLKNIDAISVKAINAKLPENENLTFYYNIRGYPTVILVTPDRNIEYAGDRSPDNLYDFVMKYIKEYYSSK